MSAIPEIQSYRDSDTLSGLLALADRKDAAEAKLARQFVEAVQAGDPLATPEWTGMVPDWEEALRQQVPLNSTNKPMRAYTVAECLSDALEMGNRGPSLTGVVQVLALAMRCSDPFVALAARQLVERAAKEWAEQNTPEVDA